MNDPRLVLASASRRRRELLAELGLHPEVRPPNVDETPHADESPDAYVTRLAFEKAGADVQADEVSLGADTVVVLGDTLLGKPGNPAEAADMLARLSGRTHRVLSAQALVGRDHAGAISTRASALSIARVSFRTLGNAEIAGYVATGEPMDKAGAYGIQGRASCFVTRIDGSYSNVVGLPVALVHRWLRDSPETTKDLAVDVAAGASRPR